MNPESFDEAASLILDAVEQVFEIQAPKVRSSTHKAIVHVLTHYCLPRPVSEVNEMCPRCYELLRAERYNSAGEYRAGEYRAAEKERKG